MHWTALMAKRYFPAHAKVADDLACIDCGYNLRTLMANAKCPECGLDVGNSLFVLAKPHVVADGLRSAGKTYLAMAITPLPYFFTGVYWPILVVMAVLSLAVVWRLVSIGQLFFRGAILRLPVIGLRLRIWLIAATLELAASITCLLMAIVVVNNSLLSNPTWAAIFNGANFAWLTITMFVPIIAAWFGHAMALALGYNWLIFELRVLQGVAALGALCSLVLLMVTISGMSNLALRVLTVLSLLGMFASLAFTFIALQHLGNAADETSGTWEELIDSDRVEIISDPPEAVRREAAAVPLSPGKPRPTPKPRVADT